MHWTYGIGCLIAVMVVMYLFIRGAQEPDVLDFDGADKTGAIKICANCKYATAIPMGVNAVYGHVKFCEAPQNVIGTDSVNGTPIYRAITCREQRESRIFILNQSNYCGVEGNWFDPKS